jgi:hypothetical protein
VFTLKSGSTNQDKKVHGLRISKKKPKARVITGSPCFTVKPFDQPNFGAKELMACGTEKGKLVVADYSPGFQYREVDRISSEDIESLKRAYYINFPQSN